MRTFAHLSILTLVAVAGCQSGPRLAGMNPFYHPERTSIQTPSQQIASIQKIARGASGADPAVQQEIVAGLVSNLQTEQDPILREAMLDALTKFQSPLAMEAVTAGLNDADPYVRQKSCRLLGEHPSEAATTALARTLREDQDFDVRVAAAKSLGGAPGGQSLLVAALEDRDPAMQFVGVEAMKQLTGQDYGGDVASYLALARGEAPAATPDSPAVQVANRLPGWVPFF